MGALLGLIKDRLPSRAPWPLGPCGSAPSLCLQEGSKDRPVRSPGGPPTPHVLKPLRACFLGLILGPLVPGGDLGPFLGLH